MLKENCIFCKIIKGEAEGVKVWEDDNFLAILDIFPNTKGMTMVIPKEHYDSDAFLMPDEVYGEFTLAAKKVAGILKKGLKVNRVAMVMEGMGVNHAHLKLYPMHGVGSEFQEMNGKEKMFFEKYPGYINTSMGQQVDYSLLREVAQEIKKNNE